MTDSSCCAGGAQNQQNSEQGCCGSKEKSGCNCSCECNSNTMTSRSMGKTDRFIRALIGIGLISLVFVGPQTPWGWVGLIPLVSAVMGWCPAYMMAECGKKSCCSKKSGETASTCCSGESGKTCCS